MSSVGTHHRLSSSNAFHIVVLSRRPFANFVNSAAFVSKCRAATVISAIPLRENSLLQIINILLTFKLSFEIILDLSDIRFISISAPSKLHILANRIIASALTGDEVMPLYCNMSEYSSTFTPMLEFNSETASFSLGINVG